MLWLPVIWRHMKSSCISHKRGIVCVSFVCREIKWQSVLTIVRVPPGGSTAEQCKTCRSLVWWEREYGDWQGCGRCARSVRQRRWLSEVFLSGAVKIFTLNLQNACRWFPYTVQTDLHHTDKFRSCLNTYHMSVIGSYLAAICCPHCKQVS